MMPDNEQKKNFYSKWIWIFTGLFISVSAAFLIFKAHQYLQSSKQQLQTKLESVFKGQEVRMGQISISVLGTVLISNVEISNAGGFKNGFFLKLEKATVRLRLRNLIKMAFWKGAHPPPLHPPINRGGLRPLPSREGYPLESLGGLALIELSQPSLFLARQNGNWNIPKITKGTGKIPLLSVNLEGGKVYVSDDLKQWDGMNLDDAAGRLYLSPELTSAHLDLKTNRNEKLELKLSVQPLKLIEAKIKVENIQASRAMESGQYKILGGISGTADFSLTWPKDWSDPAQWDYKGNASITTVDTKLGYKKYELPFSFKSEAKFFQDKIEVSTWTLKTANSEINGKGNMTYLPPSRLGGSGGGDRPPWRPTGGRVSIGMTGQLDWQEWALLLDSSKLKQGKIQFALDASGELNHPNVNGTFSISKGNLAGAPISGQAEFHYSSAGFHSHQLTAVWGQGEISASGTVSNSKIQWSGTVKNLNLQDFFQGQPHPVHGIFSTNVSISGNPAKPEIKGKAGINNLALDQYKIGSLSGRIQTSKNLTAGRFNSPDKKNRAVIHIGLTPDTIDLKQCSINLRNRESLKINALWNKRTNAIGGQVTAHAAPLKMLKPFLYFSSYLDGKLFLNGRLKGTMDQPVLESKITVTDMSLIHETPEKKRLGTFQSDFIWDKKSFILPKFVLGTSAQGSVTYQREPIPKLETNLQIRKANPKVLFAFLNTAQNVSGSLNGTVQLTYQKNPDLSAGQRLLLGTGNLLLANGNWGEIPLKKLSVHYEFNPEKLKVESVTINPQGGSLSISGEAPQTQDKNLVEASAVLKDFNIGGTLLNGKASGRGDLHVQNHPWVSGSINCEQFTVNQFSAGILKGLFQFKNNVLELDSFSWGDFFEGHGKILFPSRHQRAAAIEAEWKSTPKTVQEWCQFFGQKQVPLNGSLTLSGNLIGTPADPKFTFYSELKNLETVSKKLPAIKNGAGFSGTAQAILRKKILSSIDLQLQGPENSKISVEGQTNLKSRQLHLETSFNQMPIEQLLQAVNFELLKGKSDGKLRIHGPWSNPIIRGEVKGKQSSFGSILLDAWEISGSFKEKELLLNRMNFRGRKGSWRFSILKDSWLKSSLETKGGLFRLNADFANISLGPVFFVGKTVAEGSWFPDEKTGHTLLESYLKINECSANQVELKPALLRVQLQNHKISFLPMSVSSLSPSGLKEGETPRMRGAGEGGGPLITGSINFFKPSCVIFDQLTLTDAGKKIFLMDGEYCLDNPSFKVEGHEVDASLLSGILSSPVTIAGNADFEMEGFTKQGRPAIKGRLSILNGNIEEIPVDILKTSFDWSEGIFSFRSLDIESKNYFNVKANGMLPMKWGTQYPIRSIMDLNLKCSGQDLSFLNFLGSGWIENVKGTFESHLSMRGPPSNPKINGFLKINNGEMNSKYLAKKAKEIQTDIEIHSNEFYFRKFESTIGKGRLNLSGSLAGNFEDGELILERFNLNAVTEGPNGIPVQIPELPAIQGKLGLPGIPSKGSASFSIQLTGDRENPKIAGWALLEDTLFSYPPPAKAKKGSASWLNALDWDFELKTGKQVVFQNDFANARVEGKLQFKGAGSSLLVNGRIESDEGTIIMYGAKFILRESLLEVVQPAAFKMTKAAEAAGGIPVSKNIVYLQLKADQSVITTNAQGEKNSDTITLQLERTPLTEEFDSKKLTFRSNQNPNLSSEKAAVQAGLGIDLETASPEEKDLQLRQGVARLLDSQLASPLAKTILQRTGLVSRIEITQDSGVGREAEARGSEPSVLDPFIGQSILLEKTLGSKLGVGYKATFDRIKDKPDLIHQLQLRYPFYKGLWLYGSRELDSKENLGRDPESKVGVEFRQRFDPADWFKKSEPAEQK